MKYEISTFSNRKRYKNERVSILIFSLWIILTYWIFPKDLWIFLPALLYLNLNSELYPIQFLCFCYRNWFEAEAESKVTGEKPSFTKVIFKTFIWTFIPGGIMQFLYVSIRYVSIRIYIRITRINVTKHCLNRRLRRRINLNY